MGASTALLILGVDPGTLSVGYGAIRVQGNSLVPEGYGTIRAKEKEFSRRLRAIFLEVSHLIDRFQPSVLAVEEVFFAKNVRSAIRIGEGRAVILLSAALKDVPVIEYSSNEVKLSVAGNGHAHKTQVQYMVESLLALPEPCDSEHAADALALAICHAHRIDASARCRGGRSGASGATPPAAGKRRRSTRSRSAKALLSRLQSDKMSRR